MEGGDVATDAKQIHVDCTAAGVSSNPEVPIFGPRRITLQGLVGGFTTFSSALIAYVEAARQDDAVKNQLLEPVSPLNRPGDWIKSYRGFLKVSALQGGTGGADLARWLDQARLNLTMGMTQAMLNPVVARHVDRIGQNSPRAMVNAKRLLGEAPT
jgi:hypothetical protein